MAHEVVVRGGTIVDGTGAPAYTGDVAIDDGRIAAVGGTLDGRRVIDAAGAVVAPGWVDVHTHFDGQVTWDDQLDPSFSNGVTSLVMGNCGVGFAPCPPGGEQTLIELMEGVEDIPGTALYEGVPWGRWTSFPEYLDFLATREYAMDVGAQVPHGALRYAVMGERGVRNDDATADDLAEMRRLVAEAVAAGALGVSTSRTIFHRSIDGTAVPGTYANNDELMALAAGIVDGGGAVFEAITSSSIGAMEGLGGERFSQQHELHLLDLIARTTGRPVTFTTTQSRDYPEAWREVLAFAEAQNATGSHLYPQVASRPIGIMSTLAGYHPFMRRRAYLDLAHLPTAERALAMSEPTMKQAILHGDDVPPAQMGSMEALYLALQMATPIMFALDEVVDYEPGPERSFAALAAAAGVTPLERMYDFVCEGDGTNVAALLGAGYVHGNLDAMREMLTSPVTVTGLADAGAHVKLICDGSAPSTQLTLWTRDRTRGDTIPLEFVVEKQTRRSARLYGLHDRGTLEVGMRADVNVIDLDRLSVRRPVGHDDLPAGGFRFLQPVQGYVATFVNGVQTRSMDTDTGARPGRLLRRP
ncbi:MAG: amidohydrolase family protein [Acidimicrobiales bacterium]|nr:amidohydrolase family protein [Acidimicrobiales bacterium]MCB9392189.1 amidohydrolase family protein [Acidimicrobiaceae bacterium]